MRAMQSPGKGKLSKANFGCLNTAPAGLYGTASMDFQQEGFDRTTAAGDVTKFLGGLDPVIGEAFVPENNAMTPEHLEHTYVQNERVLL
jgi:hypothetical protein